MSTLISFPASLIPQAHTVIASLAFSVALFMGWASGLWTELCANAVASKCTPGQVRFLYASIVTAIGLFLEWPSVCQGLLLTAAEWPVEWFPSVSATIGDHAPPRAPFQILIALCATPRFLLLLSQWLVHRYPSLPSVGRTSDGQSDVSSHAVSSATNGRTLRTRAAHKAAEMADEDLDPIEHNIREDERISGPSSADVELIIGILRTFSCGGWVYITSRDQHDLHDLFMIVYLVLTLPWMFLSVQNAISTTVRRRRQVIFGGFLSSIPPLIWLYYRHSVLRIPGAYTHYAFLEWSLVFWDVSFDAIAATELSHLRIAIIDTSSKREIPTSLGSRQGVFLPKTTIKPDKVYNEDADWTGGGMGVEATEGRAALAWLSDVYMAVCFWTVFTSLGFQLFYWSVWKLALAGSELALLANLSGYTLTSRKNRGYVSSREGMVTHRIFMICAGMGCYIIPFPAARLIGISIGTWTGWLSLFGNWIRLKGSEEMLAEGKILSIGLIITVFLKYINYSNNPLWATTNASSGGWNITGLLIAGLCLYEYARRPLSLFPAPPISEEKDKPIPQISTTRLQRTLIPIGLGSLMHLIQTFITDAGTIIAWTWTGYPIKGPALHPFAGVVIAAAALSITFPIKPFSLIWSAAGLGGAYVLYSYPDWLGFNGGLVLVAYLLSIFPAMTRMASVLPPAQTLGGALVINIVLDVLSVITAAYAFVPYGWIFRERTDLVLGFCMIAIVAAGLAARSIKLPAPERLQLRSRLRIVRTNRWTLYVSAVLAVVGMATSYNKMPEDLPKPYYPDHRIFSGGIWTVHFGVDEPGRDSQRRIMELVRDMEVDVLGLLESDLHRFVYGNRDLTRVIAEELGYYVDLGPGPNKHTWGAALLSKFPILNSTHHLLPSPHGELAPAIHATLDIHGQKVNVWVSHNGQEEDALDRELQTTEIARNLRETADTPTVFLGYLVTHPGDQRPWPYQILMEDGLMWDIEIEDRWRWCEYIAFRGLWRIAFARLHEADISDTELQVGKFLLPKPGQTVLYETNQELYWHIGEEDIPEPWRMPRMFWDRGTRGHHYRVWKGPLYYLPPERSGLQRYGQGWSNAL